MSMDAEIQHALEVLRKGGVLLYPTDTIWGLGCDGTNEAAVQKIFRIKERQEAKSLIVLVNDERMLSKYVKDIPSIAHDLIQYAETPLTIVYDEGINLAKNVLGSDGSIAARIARDEFCNKLIYRLGRPLVSTSANLSNEKPPRNFREISPVILNRADYVVNWRREEQSNPKASSIIKVRSTGEIKIIRK